jgi:hypothetical protein
MSSFIFNEIPVGIICERVELWNKYYVAQEDTLTILVLSCAFGDDSTVIDVVIHLYAFPQIVASSSAVQVTLI